MNLLPILKKGDTVEIVAPASRASLIDLEAAQQLLSDWGLHCIVEPTIFGDDLLCANNDDYRLKAIKKALTREDTKAIIAIRGGYGCSRLMPALTKLIKPAHLKLFLGMSDLTALNLYFESAWKWPTIHAGINPNRFSKSSLLAVKQWLFAEIKSSTFEGTPLNLAAHHSQKITSSLVGGNLCLIQASLGTNWQVNARNKILFLEEVGERGYRIDRMLQHLQQVIALNEIKAIVLGDFIEGEEPNGSSLILPVLQRFAENLTIPVVKISGVGHDKTNYPLPLGTKVELALGEKYVLTCYR